MNLPSESGPGVLQQESSTQLAAQSPDKGSAGGHRVAWLRQLTNKTQEKAREEASQGDNKRHKFSVRAER